MDEDMEMEMDQEIAHIRLLRSGLVNSSADLFFDIGLNVTTESVLQSAKVSFLLKRANYFSFGYSITYY
jgi:hypothetical protein